MSKRRSTTMESEEKQVIEGALRLPRSARAALAARLLDSLDAEIDEDSEAAWDAEIARRLQEIDSGK